MSLLKRDGEKPPGMPPIPGKALVFNLRVCSDITGTLVLWYKDDKTDLVDLFLIYGLDDEDKCRHHTTQKEAYAHQKQRHQTYLYYHRFPPSPASGRVWLITL